MSAKKIQAEEVRDRLVAALQDMHIDEDRPSLSFRVCEAMTELDRVTEGSIGRLGLKLTDWRLRMLASRLRAHEPSE